MDLQKTLQGGPRPTDAQRATKRERLNNRVRADLGSAVWEATQVMTYDEICEYVEGALREVEADA